MLSSLRPEMALHQLDPTLEASPIPSQNIFELELRTKMTTHRILTRFFEQDYLIISSILGRPKEPMLSRLRPEMALHQLDPTLEASPIPSQNIFELELRTKMTTHRILTRIFTRPRSTRTRIFSILSSQSQPTTKMNVRSFFLESV